MAGLLDWVDPAREWWKSRPEAVRGLLGGAYSLATDPAARSEAMARQPAPFQEGSGQSMFDAAMNVGPQGLLGSAIGMTKFEKAHKVAQKNAAKPIEKGGLGLPKDNTAADRAKALGFEDDAYHGTINDFPAFAKDKIKSRFDYSFGHHTTTRPSEANYYAHDQLDISKAPYPEGGNVMPLKVRRGETLEYAAASPSRSASTVADMDRAQIIRDLLQARESGKPVDIVKTVRNFGDEYDGANLIAMRPELLRSRFAAFDPARKHEADLLAGYFGFQLPQFEER